MFSCKEVAERASLLVDDELGRWQKLKMQMHLAMCGACRAFVAQIRITRELAKAAGERERTRNDENDGPSRIYERLNQPTPRAE